MSDEPLKVEEPDLSGTYTARDYLSWQMDELVELIRGKIYKMSPAPASNHQRISRELQFHFYKFFQNKKCEFFDAPFDVYLIKHGENYKDAKNIVEPDLCVICDVTKIKKFGCVGAPDLIVEILSPSTSRKDQKEKFELYEEFGVREYWLVSPENRSVILNVLEKNKYKTFRPVTSGEKMHSAIFPDLVIDLEDVFKNVKDY